MTVRIFISKRFKRFVRKEKIADEDLIQAAREIEEGRVEADLGGRVYKKRLAGKGRGKSGGFRTILLFKKGHRLFFVYGYPKNQRANIDEAEEEGFRVLADILLALSDEDLEGLLRSGEFLEIKEADEDGQKI
jgi:hypothetical protein